jgi:hypothetical protein
MCWWMSFPYAAIAIASNVSDVVVVVVVCASDTVGADANELGVAWVAFV